MKKKAFTLTELLVVVVIIGTLAAVVLPKFTKMMETRKLTEAEDIMTAVRTEQEARCTLGKPYTTDAALIATRSKADSQNYTYSFTNSGMTATSKGEQYTLQMPSYADGRICCSGDYCQHLSRSYVACEDIPAETSPCTSILPDNEQNPEPVIPEPEPEPMPVPPGPSCTVPSPSTEKQPCGCTNSGTRSRSFNESSCSWGSWGSCTEKETDCGGGCEVPSQTTETRKCGCTNSGIQSRSFNESLCGWSDWSACTEKETNCGCNLPTTKTEECDPADGVGTIYYMLNNATCKYEYDYDTCTKEERKECSSEHREGEVTHFPCVCGEGERTWHCGEDTGHAWNATETKSCESKPSDQTYPCPAGTCGSGGTVKWTCLGGKWAPQETKSCESKPADQQSSCPPDTCGTGGTTTWACQNGKWEAQMTGECKPKPNPPATMRCHPADGEGIRTAEYLCYQGNWVIKDYVGECVKVDCTKLVINRPQFTNKRACEEYAIRYAPCSGYDASPGQYISSSHGSFVCLYSENCAGGLTLSELRTYGNYKCGPSQIVNLRGYH